MPWIQTKAHGHSKHVEEAICMLGFVFQGLLWIVSVATMILVVKQFRGNPIVGWKRVLTKKIPT